MPHCFDFCTTPLYQVVLRYHPTVLVLVSFAIKVSVLCPHSLIIPADSDYGSLTLLFQRSEGGEGLQILPSNARVDEVNWKNAGVVEGALLVNSEWSFSGRSVHDVADAQSLLVGDAMEFWTGAQMKSTLHRVRLPDVIPFEGIPERCKPHCVNLLKPILIDSGTDSIAYFSQPNPDAMLKSVLPSADISPGT